MKALLTRCVCCTDLPLYFQDVRGDSPVVSGSLEASHSIVYFFADFHTNQA